MSIIARTYHRGLKRSYIDKEVDLLSSKKIKRLPDYHKQGLEQSAYDWSLEHRNKIKKRKEVEERYHCQVYLKLYPSTCKCTLDVVIRSTNDIIDDHDSILLAKTRIAKVIKPGRTFFLIKYDEYNFLY